MSSIINSAMSGLSAAQAALSTTSNNISNYTVAGYSRQTTILAEANSTLQGKSYYGNGVNVTGVQREYDSFIAAQLRGSSATYNAANTQYSQVSNIDDLMSTSTTSLSSAIQGFFSNMQNVVSNANDPAARQSMLSNSQGLVNQFQTQAQYLTNLQNSVNTDVAANVDQINTFTSQIANLNQQIAKLTTGNGAVPNDLLDQRDQLVNGLNNIVGVTVSQQDGSYTVSMANGTSLVNGYQTTKMVAMPSNSDITRTTIGYVDAQAGNVQIPESSVTTGSLGGLLSFRSQDLDLAQNQLGQLAAAFTTSFNTVHKQGFDSNGDQGVDFFTIGGPTVQGNSKNTSSATMTAAWSNASALQASNYTVSYDGTNWSATRLSDNAKTTLTPTTSGGVTTLSLDGMSLTVNGTPNAKDSFLVKPVQNAITNMSVAITSGSQIAAAAAPGGESDNRNAQNLLALQDAKIVNGNSTLSQAYGAMVSTVGNKTQALKTASTTQQNVVTQLTNRQQSVSGVNLDEEYANLTKYQQYYMANAQVLKAASTVFDALLSIN
ncbi:MULTISPECIES: flagellar hook-associated protein FlgK [Pantoea]|uniref:Flagellar hook-associated protein 1 n=1 Tax=Pantoea stewartii subsp. stewartii DC283 TaxID=660596 RepID=H3RBV9_PANSE|nr:MULTISPECIES: flagellar hook-associated protein FlgK [Pantoea]ARF49744.1 flagellar hook-associated protein FlgK [Pantoea stewartii subsp. stewartii DC283]EHU01123.1 flagellar hook-filament junction protein 1 [Pantoea stewartii subsp. stewartii DC283]KAB0545553.1 flagellar hook-associated protein FlgK [Pantoea stewartii subsp. stewartii]KGD85039.1 flagellar hook protein FlgK [Pantoea stewartii subsp. indologenes]PXV78658.1 flagellar hook-associated protein 1 FlgK [Pantoea sp. PNA 03-3]